MKKPFYYLLLLFAALLFVPMASCSEDKDEPEIKNETDVKDESGAKDEPDDDDSFTFPTDVDFINTMKGVWTEEEGTSYMIFTTQNWPESFSYARSAILWDDEYSCVAGSMAGIPVRDGDHYYLSQSSGMFSDIWITDYEPGKRIVIKNTKNGESKSFLYSPTAGFGRIQLSKNIPGNYSSVDVKVTVMNKDDAMPAYHISIDEMSGHYGGVSNPFLIVGDVVKAYFQETSTGRNIDHATWENLSPGEIYSLSYPTADSRDDPPFAFPTDVSFIQTMEGVWLGEQGMSYMIFTTQHWPSAFGYSRSAVLWEDDYSCVGGDMSGIPVHDGDHYYLSQSSGLFHYLWITDYEPGKRIVMKNTKTGETRSFVYSKTSALGRICLTKNLPVDRSSVGVIIKVYLHDEDVDPDYTLTLSEMSTYAGSVSDPFWLCGEKVVAYFTDQKTGKLLEVGRWPELELGETYNLNY